MKQVRVSRHKIEREALHRKVLFFIYDVIETDDDNGTTVMNAYRMVQTVEIWDMEDLDAMVDEIDKIVTSQHDVH